MPPADESGPAEEVPLRPAQCRAHLRRALAAEFGAVSAAFLRQAKEGGVQHFREVVRLNEELNPAKPRRRKGSAQLLLEAVQRAKRARVGNAEDGIEDVAE